MPRAKRRAFLIVLLSKKAAAQNLCSSLSSYSSVAALDSST